MGGSPKKYDVIGHIENTEIHGKHNGSGTIPAGTDGQTLRYNAGNVLEATSDLTLHSDGSGAEVTTDNAIDGETARIINAIIAETTDALPSGYYVDGTMLCTIY